MCVVCVCVCVDPIFEVQSQYKPSQVPKLLLALLLVLFLHTHHNQQHHHLFSRAPIALKSAFFDDVLYF